LDEDQTVPSSPPLILGRYRVDATLGHGAFGDVVRAYDTRIRRPVAIKTLRPALAVQYPGEFTSLRERFEREAEASSRMGLHPNVVGIYDLAADADGALFLIMEYLPGGTLAPRIEHGPLPLAEALRLAADAARGLDAAHRNGIVHRDVKPANLFLTAEGRAKVGDFGIAQIDTLSQRSRLAVHHPGTPLYMSPEQERETGYLRAVSDEFSLGLVLYEMLTGKRYKALEPREAQALLDWHAPQAAPLVRRMTAEATGDRYPSLAAVAEEIERMLLGAVQAPAMPRMAPATEPPTIVDPPTASPPQPAWSQPSAPVSQPEWSQPFMPPSPAPVAGPAAPVPAFQPVPPAPAARGALAVAAWLHFALALFYLYLIVARPVSITGPGIPILLGVAALHVLLGLGFQRGRRAAIIGNLFMCLGYGALFVFAFVSITNEEYAGSEERNFLVGFAIVLVAMFVSAVLTLPRLWRSR
jgi:serine/threonine-protein kinase